MENIENIEEDILNKIIKKINNNSNIPTPEEYDSYFKNQKTTEAKKMEAKNLFGDEYINHEQLYKYFINLLDKEINEVNESNKFEGNQKYGYDIGYDKNIFKRIIKAFHNKNIPILIKGIDNKYYINKVFDDAVDEYIEAAYENNNTRLRLGDKSHQLNKLDSRLEKRYKNLISETKNVGLTSENIELKNEIDKLKDDLDNAQKNLELNKDNMTKEEYIYMDKKIDELKNNLINNANKKGFNLHKTIKESRKLLTYIFGILGIGGVATVGDMSVFIWVKKTLIKKKKKNIKLQKQ